MLATYANVLKPAVVMINYGLLGLGAVCAVGYAGWLARPRRRRNPLADVSPPAGGPTLLQAMIVIIVYLAGGTLALSILTPPDAQTPLTPGSPAWHLRQVAQLTVAGLTSIVAAAVLLHSRAWRPGRGATAAGRVLAVVLGLLIITPVCLLQLYATRLLWGLWRPEEALQIHPVLEAVQQTAWGFWGQALLFTHAILVAAVTEELLFRGVLLGLVWNATRRAWLAIMISAVLFGLIHGQWQDRLPLITMGLMLGYVRVRSGSLLAPMLIHALFNARTMLMALSFPEQL